VALDSTELSALIKGEILKPARVQWSNLRWLQKKIDGGLNKTFIPPHADTEYKDFLKKARSPWLLFVRDCIAQGTIVDGYSHDETWREAWQGNGMDARQVVLNREVIGLGYGYLLTLPAEGEGVVMRPLSAHTTFSTKTDPWDDSPTYVLHKVSDTRWYFWDDEAQYTITGTPEKIKELQVAPHGMGVNPVTMIQNEFALDGLPKSSIEPAIPVYERIVDATFTLQMVQRYGAFPQKYQTGGSIGVDEAGNALVRPSVDSLLHSTDYDTKFGAFPATDIGQVAEAVDTHIKHLSAVCQVPPHYLLGAIVNMSAEGIAAAESGYFRNIADHQVVMGEGYELAMRKAAAILGHADAADDVASQVHWADTSTRSLAQISDSVVKLQTVGAPLEMLFAMVPGWSKTDALEAAAYVREQNASTGLAKPGDDSLQARFTALGVAIRAGVDPTSAATSVGLSGLSFTGAIPTSLRVPQADAQALEQ
jgi:hypothetical protein